MLNAVFIVNKAGTPLFDKAWVHVSSLETKGRNNIAAVLTTIQMLCIKTAGMPMSYIVFGKMAITITSEPQLELQCILFHDESDGHVFGQMVAKAILRTFVQAFYGTLFEPSRASQVSLYSGFASKLIEAISSSVKNALDLLNNVPGIENAMVVYDDGEVTSLHPVVDTIGFVANLKAMMAFSDDIMDIANDRGRLFTLSLSQRAVIASRIGKVIFVAIIAKNSKVVEMHQSSVFMAPILEVIDLLKKLYTIIGSLQG